MAKWTKVTKITFSVWCKFTLMWHNFFTLSTSKQKIIRNKPEQLFPLFKEIETNFFVSEKILLLTSLS